MYAIQKRDDMHIYDCQRTFLITLLFLILTKVDNSGSSPMHDELLLHFHHVVHYSTDVLGYLVLEVLPLKLKSRIQETNWLNILVLF